MDVNIYILAGGKSSRMGTDKATTLFHGRPMIQYVLDVATLISPNIFILSNHESHAQFGFECIKDVIKDIGPAGGIDAMLQHSIQEKNILVSCDMPFLDDLSIQKIITASKNYDITVPLLNNYPEALIGVYHQTCKEIWRNEIIKGERKLSTLISKFNAHFINGNELQKQNPLLFSNFNSIKDIEEHGQ